MTTQTRAGWPTQTMFPGQAAAPEGPVDMTNMYLFHFAFRRDLERFAIAAARTPVDDVATWGRLAARWGVFARQLHHHHEAEDRVLWPWLRAQATGNELALLDAMEAEHEAIDPALTQMADAFLRLARTGADREDVRAALSVRLAGARETLDRHLAHEETDAMTFFQRVATRADWHVLEKQFSEGSPVSALVEMVPWALHGVDDVILRELLRKAPLPLRLLRRLTWRRFRRREDAAFCYG